VFYAWIRNNRIIYVGMSSAFGNKPFSEGHHREADLRDATSLMMFPCEAQAIEKETISELRPIYNDRLRLASAGHSYTAPGE
jgi:hypothetical protein